MTKRSAHLIIGCFDIAALAVCWLAVVDWLQLAEAVERGVQPISVQRPVGMLGLGLLVPVVHLLCSLPWQGRVARRVNVALVCFAAGTAFAVLQVDAMAERKLQTGGYAVCAFAGRTINHNNFEIWAREEQQCAQ